MIRKQLFSAALTAALFAGVSAPEAQAQDPILAQMYGRGVHAYNAGSLADANRFLTAAIDGGTKDPRAFYFRGIVAQVQGMEAQAEVDWMQGAKLEAVMGANPGIGRSLARFQGTARLKLEKIRQQGRLEHVMAANRNSAVRANEIMAAQPQAPVAVAPPVVPPSSNPITPPAAVTTPDNPFADDPIAGTEPVVEADNALKDAGNPLPADPTATAAAGAGAPAAAAGDVFGGGDAAMDAGNPFGGGDDAAADPFGGGADTAADPFGGGDAAGGDASDPFGGGSDAGGADMDDPFGADPFGN